MARDRTQNRPENRQDRRDNLQDRLDSRGDLQDDRQDARQDRLDDRQDFRDEARDDWQGWADDNYWPHYGWHHGGWQPGAGWDYMWDNYPVWSAFRTTVWGVNRLAWTFGYWGYSNPYYADSYAGGGSVAYDYSEPLVTYESSGVYESSPTTVADAPADAAAPAAAEALPPGVTEAGMSAFDAARSSFTQGDYQTALGEIDKALKEMPEDAVVHEFRALVLFALQRYDEAAATLYAVLAVGPGWDWTTLSGLYSNIGTYTEQLRALESYVKAHSDSSQAHFLLAYHYLTCKHEGPAVAQLKEVLKLTPGQKVATDMLTMIAGPEAVKEIQGAGEPVLPPPASVDAPSVTPEQIRGSWKAMGPNNSTFELTLKEDGTFDWRFTRGGQTEDVQGVWAIDGATLAMEPDSGGTMLAELSGVSDAGFTFRMAGAAADDPGLKFQH